MSEDINAAVANTPTTPDAEPTAEPKDTAAELMAELEKLNINKPEDIQGMAAASAQTGKAWNKVGELKEMLRQQGEVINQLKQQVTQPVDPYADGQTVDLGKLVETKVQGVLDNYLQNQNKMTESYYRELAEVQGNPRYAAVKDMFDAHVNRPDVAMRLRQGETSLTAEFNNVKDVYYDTLLKRAHSTMSTMTPTAKPPHMETGDTQSPVIPAADDELTDKLNRTVKARQSGAKSSDDALHDIVKAFLPQDDSMWQT